MAALRTCLLGMLSLMSAAPVASAQQANLAAQPAQIQLDLTVVELNIASEGEKQILKGLKGKKTKKLPHGAEDGAVSWTANATGTADDLVRRLKERGSAKILAQPRIKTQSGRPAVFFSGPQTPDITRDNEGSPEPRLEFAGGGVECELSPLVTKDGKVWVEIFFSHSPVASKRPRTPTIDAMVHTGLELDCGQTFFFVVPIDPTANGPQRKQSTTHFFVMVTPAICK